MTRKTLIYRWDEEVGRMRLHDIGFLLSEHDRRCLSAVLRRRYESLITQLERGELEPMVILDDATTAPGRSPAFHVRFGRSKQMRCPDLVLEQVDPVETLTAPPTATDAITVSREPETADAAPDALFVTSRTTGPHGLTASGIPPWVAGFLDDLRWRLSEQSGAGIGNADRAAIGYILAELQAQCRENPDDLAVLLLAGYVALSERARSSPNADEAGLHRLAARARDQLCRPPSLQEANAVRAAPAMPRRDTAGRLRGIARFLGRVLGLQDDAEWE